MTLSLLVSRSAGVVVGRGRYRRQRRGGRRGIVLIFVVVLLMLLAIMGTAYLAVSRADRVPITRNGSIAGAVAPPRLFDRTRIDSLFDSSQTRIKTAIIEDLFNVAPGTLQPLQAAAARKEDAAALRLNPNSDGAVARARVFAAFKQTQLPAIDGVDAIRYYENYDAPGRADAWLASLLSEKITASTLAQNPLYRVDDVVWPWISAPLKGELSPGIQTAPFFADPRNLNRSFANGFSQQTATQYDESAVTEPNATNEVIQRHNIKVASVTMLRSASDAVLDADRTTRVYPGFTIPAGVAVTRIAADADGDGIADSMLMPVVLNPRATGVDQYLDTANNVVYFVAYRVVDNSAQININTALTATGDFKTFMSTLSEGGGTSATSMRALFEANTPDAPNLGFYRSNVGLAELIRNSTELFPITSGTQTPMQAEMDRLFDARFPQVAKASAIDPAPVEASMRRLGLPTDPISPNPIVPVLPRYFEGNRNTIGTTPLANYFYEFATFGDLLEQQVARRPDNAGSLRSAPGTSVDKALVSLPVADAVAMAYEGGAVLSPRLTPAIGENALLLSTHMLAPNFSTSASDAWRYFPPREVATWYGWTKDFAPQDGPAFPVRPALPPTTLAPTDFAINLLDETVPANRQFAFSAAPNSGMASVTMPRSIRPLLTTESGVSSIVAQRPSTNGLLPPGMPTYGSDLTAGQYPPIRVAAATGTKEQLWRAYWSVMTQNQLFLPNTTSLTWVPEKFLAEDETRLIAPTTPTGEFSYAGGVGGSGKDYDAFLPPDRHASSVTVTAPTPTNPRVPVNRLSTKQMTLIRSAVAACNTVDLRDTDNDITAMTVDLGETVEHFPGDNLGNPADPPQANRTELYARVYGTEKQLVISAVVIDDTDGPGPPDAATTYVAVEIFNPSDETLDLRGYHLAVMQRGTPNNTTTADGLVTVDPAGLDQILTTGTATTLAPGGFIVVASAATPPTGGGIHITPPTSGGTGGPGGPSARGLSAAPTADPDPNLPPTQVVQIVDPGLIQVQGVDLTGLNNREIALLRTRRADGQPYTESNAVQLDKKFERPAFSESIAAPADLTTLVPIDAIDVRSLVYAAGGSRHWYMRPTIPPNRFTPNPWAWKMFYAGRCFYDPLRVVAPIPPGGYEGLGYPATYGPPTQSTPTAAPERHNYAWRSYPDPANPALITVLPSSTEGTLGNYRNYRVGGIPPAPQTAQTGPPDAVTTNQPTPYLSPTIPIQNATPSTAFDASTVGYTPVVGEQDYPPFRFPYGSPFARNGDVLNVPFIGSYKIYRVLIVGFVTPSTDLNFGTSAAWALYEYVPLPMDAVNVAYDSKKWSEERHVNPDDPDYTAANPFMPNPSVGRFDARRTIGPRNDWAVDLFDFVTARQSYGDQLQFPDVPSTVVSATSISNDPTMPATDQDGPVIGTENTLNPVPDALAPIGFVHPSLRTKWIAYYGDSTTGAVPRTSAGRTPGVVDRTSDSDSKLIQGTINLNTAPPVVLRMLPWTVDPANGYLTQQPGTTMNTAQRLRVGLIEEFLNAPTTSPRTIGRLNAPRNAPPYGFASAMDLATVQQFGADDPMLAAANYNQRAPMMLYGLLNPGYRSAPPPAVTTASPGSYDSNVVNLNMTRVSNLTSQRSDVYTVYVTVQAWTWVGDARGGTGTPADKQYTGTRLVGERRGSFIVDRSRISQTNFQTSDLIIHPIEQE